MGLPDSTVFTTEDVKEVAKRMVYGYHDSETLYQLGLDRLHLEQKFRNHVRPLLSDLRGFEPLEKQYRNGVETLDIWREAMETTPLRDTQCLRLERCNNPRGIGMYRDGRLVFETLVFLTKRRQWITVITEQKYELSDFWWPRNFVHHNNLEDMVAWSEGLIEDEGLDRVDANGESFVIMLCEALDDLVRSVISRRCKTLRKLEAVELEMRMQNMCLSGFQYLSSDRDYSIQEGLMQ